MSNNTISILGCGWLGTPLAVHLLKQGYTVKGSTTTESKILELKRLGIKACLLESKPQVFCEKREMFFNSDVLFLNIPFERSLENPEYYTEQIDWVLEEVREAPVNFIIFASSTSVYPGAKPLGLDTEPIVPENRRAAVLLEIERDLMRNDKVDTTILRFAGLYGEDREIGQTLLTRESIIDKNAPTNLVHLDDCIEIITEIIDKDIRNEVFNVCSDEHPTREQLYTQVAKSLKLPAPKFSSKQSDKVKIISNEKIKKVLGYKFKHPNPIEL